MARELNEKQKSFCNEYIIDFNGTQAAIRAGYNFSSDTLIRMEHLSQSVVICDNGEAKLV